MAIRFDASKGDFAIIQAIAARAVAAAKEAGWQYTMSDAQMDLTACHRNGTPLKLAELLAADDFNFSHDVFGIHRNLDRRTGKLMNHFHPRFAMPQEHRGSRALDSDIDASFADAAFRGFEPETPDQAEALAEKGGRR